MFTSLFQNRFELLFAINTPDTRNLAFLPALQIPHYCILHGLANCKQIEETANILGQITHARISFLVESRKKRKTLMICCYGQDRVSLNPYYVSGMMQKCWQKSWQYYVCVKAEMVIGTLCPIFFLHTVTFLE